jgi:hypothetical protein
MRKLLTSTLACALLLWAAQGWAQDIRQYPATATGVSLKAISATAVQATGTAEEVVRTYPIPASLLAKSGDALRVKMSLTSAANANAKTVRLRLGGIGGAIIFTLAGANATIWDVEFTIYRTTAANAQLNVSRYNGSAAGSGIPGTATSTVDLSAATDLVLTFSCPTAATDLTSNAWTVELLKL